MKRLQTRFTIGVPGFSDADKRPCADHWSAKYVFPTTAVGKLRGLSITDTRRCMPVRTAWAISGSENKVKLSSAFSIAFRGQVVQMTNAYPESSKTIYRPIYIGKNQNPKNQGFLLYIPFTLPEKPIAFGVLARKAHARKNLNLILVFW